MCMRGHGFVRAAHQCVDTWKHLHMANSHACARGVRMYMSLHVYVRADVHGVHGRASKCILSLHLLVTVCAWYLRPACSSANRSWLLY